MVRIRDIERLSQLLVDQHSNINNQYELYTNPDRRMENMPPMPPPLDRRVTFPLKQLNQPSLPTIGWEVVEAAPGSSIPCQRSLHAGAVWRDQFLVFGGYDGLHRVNDLYSFDFKTSVWRALNNTDAPSPRDRHVAVVYSNCLYIFGGFDGVARVNDLHAYDLEKNRWQLITPTAGTLPSARHSHSAVVYQDNMFIFGGYDGSYRSDFHAFNFFTKSWRQVQGQGDIPRARYRGTCVVCGESMILHGGHDGTRHLQDTHIFDFPTSSWSTLTTEGPIPSPRDSHVAVIYGKSMYLYGGSTGT
jgi:N-acetylneuraminic acid mutarotase